MMNNQEKIITAQELVAEAKPHVQEINVNTAVIHINAGSLISDVREPFEFEAAHLPGAINIPRGVIEFKISDHPLLSNKAVDILLYCKTGGRSLLSALNLQRMGYTRITSLSGGFDGWVSHHEAIAKDATEFGS
jgi:rhodanese-related sulfurtransferase